MGIEDKVELERCGKVEYILRLCAILMVIWPQVFRQPANQPRHFSSSSAGVSSFKYPTLFLATEALL